MAFPRGSAKLSTSPLPAGPHRSLSTTAVRLWGLRRVNRLAVTGFQPLVSPVNSGFTMVQMIGPEDLVVWARGLLRIPNSRAPVW